ncbi:hypothetical protein [Symmachiella dynata]|uniref:hypothetical protein n=1 Tax=Symmachiella dynata TaxID=2527995 RepID=UPI0011A9B7C4|nr:hypothetical protein [Symmachiella dynata]
MWNAFFDVFFVLLGAIGAFFFVFDRFGGLGGQLILSAFLFFSFLFRSLRQGRFRPNWRWYRCLASHFNRDDLANRVLLILAMISLLAALICWIWGVAELRMFRRQYTLNHDHIALAKVDTARRVFGPESGAASKTQQAAEFDAMSTWVRWMYEGAEREVQVSDKNGDTYSAKQDLYFIESEPFEDRYTDINAFVKVHHTLQIVEGVAFLMDPVPGVMQESSMTRWSKPAWRQMYLNVEQQSKESANFIVSCPNPGDRLVLFLRLEPKKGEKFPGNEQIIPSKEIGVRK